MKTFATIFMDIILWVGLFGEFGLIFGLAFVFGIVLPFYYHFLNILLLVSQIPNIVYATSDASLKLLSFFLYLNLISQERNLIIVF